MAESGSGEGDPLSLRRSSSLSFRSFRGGADSLAREHEPLLRNIPGSFTSTVIRIDSSRPRSTVVRRWILAGSHEGTKRSELANDHEWGSTGRSRMTRFGHVTIFLIDSDSSTWKQWYDSENLSNNQDSFVHIRCRQSVELHSRALRLTDNKQVRAHFKFYASFCMIFIYYSSKELCICDSKCPRISDFFIGVFFLEVLIVETWKRCNVKKIRDP